MTEYMNANQRHWDELVAIHVRSEFYNVAAFKAGESSLLPVERAELGDVAGKTLLHLQCHFGMDTLSWARAGAIVTGVDFSHEAIEAARALANEVRIDARFIETNVYDLPSLLAEQFDIVFTSYGAINWLPDIRRWAEIAAGYVKPGGRFYIIDGHPITSGIDDASDADNLRLVRPYFKDGPTAWDEDGDYADHGAKVVNRLTYEFNHTLGDIVTALIDAGLRVEFLHEFPFCAWQRLPSMVRGDDGYWRLPDDDGKLPFLFSLRAAKPAE